MRTGLVLPFLALAAQALSTSGAERLVDSLDSADSLSPNADGGQAPAITISEDGGAGRCVRLQYTNGANGWGNVRRALTVEPADTGLYFRLKVNRAAPGAAFHVWLFEQDADGYIVRVRVDGNDVDTMGSGWHEVSLPFPSFRFQPRGDKKRAFMTIDRMLFGCNFADMDLLIDDLRITQVKTGSTALPRTSGLAAQRGRRGAVGILSEPTVAKAPGHADPARLQALLSQAGFGVTLLRAGDLADATLLTPKTFDVVVLPSAPFFPREAIAPFKAYLRGGGAFVSLGGYAFDQLQAHADGVWDTVDVSVTAADMDRQRGTSAVLNTRHGKAGDTMGLRRDQIGVFDPSYELRNAVDLRAAADQFLLSPDWTSQERVEGMAAVAMTGSNSPVFPDVYGRWVPLVEATDRYGRSRGAVGALVQNVAGPYAKAGWAFFGATNTDLFDGRFAILDKMLVDTVERLVALRLLYGLSTDLACYRRGETMRISVDAHLEGTFGKAAVRIAVGDTVLSTTQLDTPGAHTIEARWPVMGDALPFYTIEATLEVDGKATDVMRTGVVIWDEDVLARGPTIDLQDNYFRFRGTPTLVSGTNQTGMMWYSANENPLVWRRDFAKMNDCGQNVMRILHFSPFALDGDPRKRPYDARGLLNRPLATQRKTDAIVQLAQQNNVVIFLTVHDWMPVELTDEQLAAQRDWNRFWADRYRDVPGIIYDIQNEPRVALSEQAHIRKLAADWLTAEYGSTAQAISAWGRNWAGIADVPLSGNPADWGDLWARDIDRFRVFLLQRWAKENVAGLKEGDPGALVTIGHLQHLTAADKLLGANDLDFTCTHFYGTISRFRRILKMIDRRFEGKTFTVGEFGSRIAHDARTAGRLGDPAEASVAYYLAVGHYAAGMGASLIANWDWKDFQDCVFPWGINHPDLVSKPVLDAFRNMTLLFRLLEPRYQAPELYLVFPDSNRFGAHSGVIHDAMLRSIDWLLGCHVPFGVINEEALEGLPVAAKALIWPVPYCPSDEVFSQVRAFVEAGGNLYVSGDVRYDRSREATRLGRLRELGVPEASSPIPPFPQPDGASAPPVWGEAGKGRVCWVRGPVELYEPDRARDLYRSFVAETGLKTIAVESDDAAVHVFRLPVRGGTALIAHNDGEHEQMVSLPIPGSTSRLSLVLAPGRPGLVLVRNDGAIVALEAQGDVMLGGQRIASFSGHQALVALDGLDVRRSQQLAVIPFGEGAVMLRQQNKARERSCEVGQFRSAEWGVLEEQKLETTTQGQVRLSIEPASAYDLRLVASKDQMASARAALTKLLLRSR